MAIATLFWFRKSLRLHDNPALHSALQGSSHLFPVYCLDPHFVASGRVGANRMHFLLESLRDLDASLRRMNSRLIVLEGSPRDSLPRAMRSWGVGRLAFEVDTEPYAVQRDDELAELARGAGVEVLTRWGHTLCDLDALLRRSGGTPTVSYGTFLGHLKAELKAQPPTPLEAPSRLPPVGGGVADGEHLLPAASALGLGPRGASVILVGGESEALRRMDECVGRKGGAWVGAFEKPSTSPTSLDPFGEGTRSTTLLSPYLKFGCLSARLLHERLSATCARQKAHSLPPVSLHGQLYWREFYYTVARGTPNYEKMAGNAICRQIPWEDEPRLLAAWEAGATGYPWIDACMAQLREEGWIHHLARHAVACFLTRGDLWQSWEKGAAVFDELLLDADPAINYGNWMWLSCSCFFYQYFRCYSPVAFPKKYDKEGAYVRKWLPQLKDFPSDFIYEPWKAPLSAQKRAKCVIGVDYPGPIVDHQAASAANMAKMQRAYDEHKRKAAAMPPPVVEGTVKRGKKLKTPVKAVKSS